MYKSATATLMDLDQTVPVLASPDTGVSLRLREDALESTKGQERFSIRQGLPLLFPAKLQPFLSKQSLEMPWQHYDDPLLQYALISSIKQNNAVVENNIDVANEWYQKHLSWRREILQPASGRVLDIGCDNPELGASLISQKADYLGLDSFFAKENPFRIIGLAELF